MKYCTRCTYPAATVNIMFDEDGLCSACSVAEEYEALTPEFWKERADRFANIASEARDHGASKYDCVIPVSGGKDSHYQVHVVKEHYGLNPLLVTANHVWNTTVGLRNLRNLVKEFE